MYMYSHLWSLNYEIQNKLCIRREENNRLTCSARMFTKIQTYFRSFQFSELHPMLDICQDNSYWFSADIVFLMYLAVQRGIDIAGHG